MESEQLSTFCFGALGRGLHPYVLGYLLTHPSKWAGSSEPWTKVSEILSKTLIDADFFIRPQLIGVLGPTLSYEFYSWAMDMNENYPWQYIVAGEVRHAPTRREFKVGMCVVLCAWMYTRIVAFQQKQETKPGYELPATDEDGLRYAWRWMKSEMQDITPYLSLIPEPELKALTTFVEGE